MRLSLPPLFTLSLCCCTAVFAVNKDARYLGDCPDGNRHYRATIRHIESGGIGYNHGYTTLETFFASDPSQWEVTPFLDARGHVFDNGKWAANAGIGLRSIWGHRTYGVNTYYDYRNTSRLNYNQIGAGLETLGELFDFRINGYFPVGKDVSAPYDEFFETFFGNSMLVSQKCQFAMAGTDIEFGFHFGKSELFDFYAAAGPYYFVGDLGPNVWGGKARISGIYRDILAIELSDSYDGTFHNKFQGQLSLTFSFGPKSKIKKKRSDMTCKLANALNSRMLQPVGRQEIIVIDNDRQNVVAIDPATGLPYTFIFVDNTGHSNGTYESPYHTLAQAQDRSNPNDIIYVFPGDGTTTGMNTGIALKADQKFWGSATNHSIQTTQGVITIPAQTAIMPTITNETVDENIVILATNNDISGFVITSTVSNYGIVGIDPQNVQISSCTIMNCQDQIHLESSEATPLTLTVDQCTSETAITFAISAVYSGDADISLTNNQFLENANGAQLSMGGASTLSVTDNTFHAQASTSEPPISIIATGTNLISAICTNNVFSDNTEGSIQVNFTGSAPFELNMTNNLFTNNGSGTRDNLGSNIVINPNGQTVPNCAINLAGNTFSGNNKSSLFVSEGTIIDLQVTATSNNFSDNASALIVQSEGTTLTLNAMNNTMTDLTDNGIAVISDSPIQTATVIITGNTINNTLGGANGISLTQPGTSLITTITHNEITNCGGSGISCSSPPGFGSVNATISNNVINNCSNTGDSTGAGIQIEQYLHLTGTIANNSLSGNDPTHPGIAIVSSLTSPVTQFSLTNNTCTTDYSIINAADGTMCLNLTGNTCDTTYQLINTDGGIFNLSPCNVDAVNVGTIDASDTIIPVVSCPGAVPCS